MTTQNTNLGTVIARLDQLQRENASLSRRVRRLQKAIAGSAILMTLIGVLGAAAMQQDTVTARTFRVVDADGNLRGSFGWETQGDRSALRLLNRNGADRLTLRAFQDNQTDLDLFGGQGGSLSLIAGTESNIFLQKEDTESFLNLKVRADGSSLLLRDANGNTVFSRP